MKSIKKPNFIKRWIYQLVKEQHGIDSCPTPNPGAHKLGVLNTNELTSENCVEFRIHFASGGRIVQFHRYDHKNDRRNQRLYIINEEKDLGRELSKILTLEGLRL